MEVKRAALVKFIYTTVKLNKSKGICVVVELVQKWYIYYLTFAILFNPQPPTNFPQLEHDTKSLL